ncbi:MAG TPA: DUF448 domain-containing protein [Anaeromyxobacteraceae bacterium]|nr:DUF448 domain-containing protein [Anaeromyxobacteraceae bacterium]
MREPERTCIGCGGKAARGMLARMRIEGTTVIVDRKASGGRGAWMHRGGDCLERAVRRRAFARAFRRSDLRWDVASLRAGLTEIAGGD